MSQNNAAPTVAPVERQPGLLCLARLWSGNALSCFPKQAYQDPFTSWKMLGNNITFVTDPDALRVILVDAMAQFPKSPMEMRALRRVLGDCIFTVHDTEWKWLRAFLAPYLSRTLMLKQVPRIVSEVDHAVKRALPRTGSVVIPAQGFMQRPASRVISKILFGDSVSFDEERLLDTMSGQLMQSRWEVLYGFLRMPPWVPCPSGSRNTPAARDLHQIIRRCLQQMASHKVKDRTLLCEFARAEDPTTGRRINEKLAIDNLMSLLFAGFETVAIALSWCLYLLAVYPKWQDRIAAEVRKVCGNGPVNAQHLERLTVTRAIFQEALRLYPPVPLITRKAQKDHQVSGYQISRGTNCILPIYAIHRHDSHYEDAEAFRPERFMCPDGRHTRHAYLPFGAGPRTCPGAQLAMIEGVTALATLIRQVQFSPVEDYVPIPVARISLRPAEGLPIRISRRKTSSDACTTLMN